MSYTYKYPRPAVTADCLIFSRDSILLIKRKNPPFQGRWVFPGGFVEPDESLVAAARRELCEETGLSGVRLTQLAAFGDPGRDPRGHVITVAFIGELGSRRPAVNGRDDAALAAWHPLAKTPPLGFDHAKILKLALGRRR